METDFSNTNSYLDKFLNEVTTNVLKCAIERVDNIHEITDIEDNDIIEQLNQSTMKESVLNSISTSHIDYPEIPFNTDETTKDIIHTKCSKLVENIISEACTEVGKMLDSEEFKITEDIPASRKKLRLLLLIKNSDRLQNYFQNISMDIIRDVLEKIRIDYYNVSEVRPSTMSGTESDIGPNINMKEGNNLPMDQKYRFQNMAHLDTTQNSDLTASDDNDFVTNNGRDPEGASFYSIQNEASVTQNQSCSDNVGFTTADSVMFTTADEQQSYEDESSESQFISFNNESGVFRLRDDEDMIESTPRRPSSEADDLEADKTLTNMRGPRQSTPITNDGDFEEDSHSLPSAETSKILPADGSQPITNDHIKALNKPEHDLPVFADDDSSIGDPSSPRTLSRQSSAFGNITLEFETEWESGMPSFEEENRNKPQEEEKHTVILHELSFDERADLKAPELLGPVFLAVLDDDEEDEDSVKAKKKLSQSIDDLCEMISEDEDDQDLPLRRRAMSLECQKPVTKLQRTKVPTKAELIKAFQDLRDEILEDKDLDEMAEEIESNVEDEARSHVLDEGVVEESMVTDRDINDPLRWHTLVFNGQHKVIDLKLLEPFVKVLTHGGYHDDGDKKTVIVVLTACNLPSKKMKRYPLLMEQLFFFIISTMDILVTSEEYIFVYFHGGTDKNQSPGLSWLKKYYQHINRRLRKSVTKVYVVHANLWLKSIFRLCRPFISSNFTRKLKFVSSLKELATYIRTDFIYIPDEVIRVDPDYKKVHAC